MPDLRTWSEHNTCRISYGRADIRRRTGRITNTLVLRHANVQSHLKRKETYSVSVAETEVGARYADEVDKSVEIASTAHSFNAVKRTDRHTR